MNEEEFENIYDALKQDAKYQKYCSIIDYKDNKIKELQQENKQLEEQLKQYENPEDLTLMFMYCEENAKDKIKKLQQENKQLKEEKDQALNYIRNYNSMKLRYQNSEVREKLNIVKNILNNRLYYDDKKVMKLQIQLKHRDEVIDEAIKYIEENTKLEHDGDDYGYTEWIDIKEQNIVFINSLLAILQKYKGDSNG